jgi:hypothetical protein
MDTFDVPEFKTIPECPEDLGSTPISAFADTVLTALFAHAPAIVHAEFQGDDQSQPVVWFVRPMRADPDQKSLPVVTSDCLSHFRAALARFGHHYMKDQLYNGYSLLSLRQRGSTYRTYIYMSNGGLPGFWIKIYAALA